MKRLGAALPAVLLAAIALGLLLFAALPLAAVIARALGFPGDIHAFAWLGALAKPERHQALVATVETAAGATALAVVLGVALALVLTRLDVAAPALWRALLSLPAAVPPYLWGIAWIDLANPRTGLLNTLAERLGARDPVFGIYGIGGIVWVLGLSFFPLVLLPVAAALERMDASLEESARIAGASPARALGEITLPLIVPSIASAAVLVFLLAAAAYGVPYLLGTGGSERVFVLTTAIVNLVNVGGEKSLADAMSLALVLLAVSLAVSALGGLAARGERKRAVVTGKSQRPRLIALGRGARALVHATLALVLLVAVVMPVGTLVLVSLIESWGSGFGPANWGTSSYTRVLLTNHETLPALARSTGLGVLAASLATVVGAIVGYARRRRPGLATRAIEGLANAPYAVPGTVLAMGLLLVWSREVRLIVAERLTLAIDLFAGSAALAVAYVVKYLSFGVRTTTSALAQLDPTLEEAARVAGARPARAAIDVVVPLIAPALAATWLLVFLPVLSEITMSVLLVGPGTSVIGTVLFELQSYADPPAAAVVATVLVAATLAGQLAVRAVRAPRAGGSAGAEP
ncbi:MAG: iron ABC transporter permease [bacterium]